MSGAKKLHIIHSFRYLMTQMFMRNIACVVYGDDVSISEK